MNAFFKKLTITSLSASILAMSMMPTQAMPLVAAPQVENQVVNVQYYDRGGPPRYWRDGGRDRGWDRRGDRGWDNRYERRHRSHGDAWVPLAAGALIAGALIAGSAASQPRYASPPPARAGINPRHYEWCSARYRSYDGYSNTFQPYGGPRQQCLSPFY